MSKKLILSVATISMALAAVGGVTIAYFSDTETSTGNTFTTGTIDIAVDGENPWSREEGYEMLDMKPGYTKYIDFEIQNVGTNPANVWKKLTHIETSEGIMSEPECDEYGGTWVDYGDHCSGGTEKHDIDTVIGYDLSVELYDESDNMVWSQMLYNDDIMLSELPVDGMYLGMIPTGWSMKVHQSYHMDDDTGNWAQGDTMSFDIELYAEQLKGELVLENKSGEPNWDIQESDAFKGTLTYEVVNPTFKFEFDGVVPLANTEYVLISYSDPWPGAAGTYELGRGTSDGSGAISLSGDVELNANLDNSKIWLVPASTWDGTQMSGWDLVNTLFETGLLEYSDTDL